MSESPFSPDTGRSGAKRVVLLMAVGVIVVAGVVLLVAFGTGDDAGERPSESSDGSETTQSPGPAQPEETEDGPDLEEEASEEKAEDAAGKYIQAVYGYSGNSEKEYRQAVMEHSQSYDLLSSPGGGDIQNYAEEVDDGGISTAARMTSFEVREASGEQITATVEFVAGDGSDGQITGKGKTYSQDLNLRPHQDTYKVNYATLPEPV